MSVMGARRLVLSVLVCMCALSCVLVGAGSAWAGSGSLLFGPLGEEAGQIKIQGSDGMAVDQQSGDIYVSDQSDNRIEEFDGSGEFVRGWGWGVIPPGEEEFQVCTSVTGCGQGLYGSGVGEFNAGSVAGVAVDNEPGASHGDVYVEDTGNHRVQVFDSEGKFLRMFGGHVNKNGSDVCVASEAAECQGGTEGEGDGEFDWASEHSIIAVGPGGDVYVGDKARVQVFEPSGVWKENISLSALSSEGKVTALAVNSAGDVFVKVEGVPGVRGFEADGIEMLAKYDENSEAVESVVVGAAGDLFISEAEPFYRCGECGFLEYGPSGVELEDFGGGTLVASQPAMAFDETHSELLVYGTNDKNFGTGYENHEYGHYGVWAFGPPSPGPLVGLGSEKSSPGLDGAAVLEGLVDPEGASTEVKFEYVDEADFRAGGYTDAVSTTQVVLGGSGFVNEHVEAVLPAGSLVVGATYHWRVVAHSSLGTSIGSDQVFEEVPSALVEGPWVTDVTSTSVTLSGKIDPLGVSTSYRLEYGGSVSYGHVFAGSVGEGMGYVSFSYHVQDLEAGTTYHYRVVSENSVGSITGYDHTFTTQLASGALLPDGRAWELVSPSDTGALIEDVEGSRAASDGSGIVYSTSEPIGEGIVGHVGHNAESIAGATVISTRDANGWRTRDISPKETLPPEGQTATNTLSESAEVFMTFSPDLSLGVFEPLGGGIGSTPQSTEASEPTLYVRDNTSETYEPLVTTANVPPGTKWDPELEDAGEEMHFLAATPDLSHIVLSDGAALTPEASTETGGDGTGQNLYEWSGGHLQLVNILPNDTPEVGASFGSNTMGVGNANNPWALSSDGRWVVFRMGRLYVRDMVEHKTVTVPFRHMSAELRFETMSRDGSKVFYLEPEAGVSEENSNLEGELFVFDPASGVSTDLSANHLDGEPDAGVRNTLMGISENGSYVYFVASGVLASGGTRGQDNLYVMHEEGGSWKTTFIATLSSEDQKDWDHAGVAGSELAPITRMVTPNGRYLTFMSDRSLTGYDNDDAVSGQPDEEVYLYDAETNKLVCASCNPSGARPLGVHDVADLNGKFYSILMDQSGAWNGAAEDGNDERGHWLAADIAPEWHVEYEVATERESYLSEDGRLFFNSSDALVPQDTNGLADVYEYEPPGVGDCTNASATFNERSDGCVNLISSGQSSTESTFLEASETGDDVFFITSAKLVNEDAGDQNAVYDAHVCTTTVPCSAAVVSPPPCTSGDSCKAAPSPQPEIFGSPPSATFNGTGNVTASPTVAGVRSKSSTNAQKLADALKVCHKKKNKRKRAACERQARKRHPVSKRSGKAKANGKGAR